MEEVRETPGAVEDGVGQDVKETIGETACTINIT